MFETSRDLEKIAVLLSPQKTILGKGALGQVGREAAALGGRRVLLVTDPGVVKAGLLEAPQRSLEKENMTVEIFDGVEADPPVRVVDACIQRIKEKEIDLVVGIGGGSALDVAKGAAALAPNGGQSPGLCGPGYRSPTGAA